MLEKEFIVTKEKTALAQGSGDLLVLATPALVAMLENTAKEQIKAELSDGDTTVGTEMKIAHLKPSPVGAQIACRVIALKTQKSLYFFELEAYMGAVLIAKASHTRAIVDIDKFMGRLNS